MSRPRTAIRQMREVNSKGDEDLVLVVPYNPTARLAMIRRTVKTIWSCANGETRKGLEAFVMQVIGTALTPSR